ncbi:MAG: hypothetical protein KAI47_12550, partial [Deltaproteobacteria bacterium]|nr:hypothetical protein [Deltaproteobacteria bacterium]
PPARRSSPGESVQAFSPVRGWSLSGKSSSTVELSGDLTASLIDLTKQRRIGSGHHSPFLR